MSSYFYYEAGDLRFCRSTTKSYGSCPFTETNGRGVAPGWLQDVFDASDDPEVRSLDATVLFVSAHRSAHRHADDPARCVGCGARRPFLGWGVWIEEPWPDEEATEREARAMQGDVSSALSTREMNLRLGNTHRRRPGSLRYFTRKRDTTSWCVENQAVELAAIAASDG